MEDIVVSDFDGVLFKKYHGLIDETITYLNAKGLPVYVVTYRAQESNVDFMINTLTGAVDLMGIAFADSRSKDPVRKVICVSQLMQKYNVVEALDNDIDVVLHYNSMGIPARHITGV